MSRVGDPQHISAGREERLLLALAAIYAALSVIYSNTIPLGYGPDEPRHFAYVRRLVEKRELPRLVNDREEDGAIVLHPPLYYALLTPFYAAFRGLGDAAAQRALRFLSLLLCGAAIAFFYAALRHLFPDRPALRVGAVGIAALWPHLQLESAVINNDTLAILLGALLIWQLARLRDYAPTEWDSLGIGLTLAAFANTKATGLTLSPLWALWLLVQFGRGRLKGSEIWPALVFGYVPLLLLGSGWYLRNILLYGKLVPLPVPPECAPADWRTGHIYAPLELLKAGLLFVGPMWSLIWRAIGGLFVSAWVQVGWFPNALSSLLYMLLGLLVAAAAWGHAGWVRAIRRKKAEGAAVYPPAVLFMFLAFALLYANTAAMAVFIHIGFYQGGRYLLPALWGLVVFLVLGLERLAGRRSWPVLLGVVGGFVALNGFCLYNLITYLNPLYAPQ